MSDKILLRRGNKADMPTFAVGEPGIALDEQRLYFGTTSGNVAVPRSTQDGWIAPTMINGWLNYGGGFSNAGYYKDDFGVVRLRGLIKSGALGQNAFLLPVGYRPASRLIFSVHSADASAALVLARADVWTDGSVFIVNGNSSGLSLDGISFRAEQ